MNRYGPDNRESSEYEPGSRRRVLRNLQGVRHVRKAQAIESDLLARAYEDSLAWVDTKTRFSAELIQQMHKFWLAELYPMAGQYREVDLTKGGFTFCHALYVPKEMDRLEKDVLAGCTPCSGTRDLTARKIAAVHAELLMIHPFREGNGRLARWIADLMSMQAGFPNPDYDLTGAKKRTYFAAMRRAYLGDLTDLTVLFASWIEHGSRRRSLGVQPK